MSIWWGQGRIWKNEAKALTQVKEEQIKATLS